MPAPRTTSSNSCGAALEVAGLVGVGLGHQAGDLAGARRHRSMASRKAAAVITNPGGTGRPGVDELAQVGPLAAGEGFVGEPQGIEAEDGLGHGTTTARPMTRPWRDRFVGRHGPVEREGGGVGLQVAAAGQRQDLVELGQRAPVGRSHRQSEREAHERDGQGPATESDQPDVSVHRHRARRPAPGSSR